MKTTTDIDFLIVGQGLAGTLLAHFLLAEKKQVRVVDTPLPGASSKIAAGVINPVTGRRIAKSWRFDELRPFARKTYLELEALLGIEIWQERNILRALHNNFEENEWHRRGAFPEYAPYFEPEADAAIFEGKIKAPYAWGELRESVQVALPELIAAYRKRLVESGLLIQENFDYQQVTAGQGRAQYKNFTAKKIIFCEGASAIRNPFFSDLPFVVTKGELLIVRIPGAGFDKTLKHKIFIVPIRNVPGIPAVTEPDLYWAGSTSHWEFEDALPSEENRQWLLGKLRQVLGMPFEVVAHFAGIRPTVQDVRPFLGLHPDRPALAIFNGLGTKGASLGPFFAAHMAGFLVGQCDLDAEVDIARFSKMDS